MYVLYSDVVSISIYLLFIVRYTSDKFDVFAHDDIGNSNWNVFLSILSAEVCTFDASEVVTRKDHFNPPVVNRVKRISKNLRV